MLVSLVLVAIGYALFSKKKKLRQSVMVLLGVGVIAFGSTWEPLREALDLLGESGLACDRLHLKSFPFSKKVFEFIEAHRNIIIVEQNRDGQLRQMLMSELDISPEKLSSVKSYDGMPVTAQFLVSKIKEVLG